MKAFKVRYVIIQGDAYITNKMNVISGGGLMKVDTNGPSLKPQQHILLFIAHSTFPDMRVL